MITLRPIPLFGSGIAGKSYIVTRQRRLNCYLENRQDGDKSRIVIFGTPGLVSQFKIAATPVRGLLGTQSALFAISGNSFQHISAPNTVVGTGSLGTVVGNASMATNSTQVVIADGTSGYLYNINTHVFSTQVAAFPFGAQTVTNVSGFFVAEQPGTQQFWVSDFNDGSTWNSLAFASASSYSDQILAVDNLGGNLLTFSQLHMEFWQNSGLTPQPFTPILSAANEYGLAAIFSRAHVLDNVIFLAQTRQGTVTFVRVNGFTANPISTPDLDYIVNSLGTVSNAVAFSYGQDRHAFYQITFPTAGTGGRSFLYDLSTDLWSEVQTGPSVNPVRHIANLSAYFGGQVYVSDHYSNIIYNFSPTAYTDNGATTVREIVTRHILSAFNRIRVASLYLDMETGIGLQNAQGSAPRIMLQYSKDNGRSWSAERWVSMGAVGQYLTRVVWRRFGSTRDATFRIRMTDPVKFVIAEGAMKVRQKSAPANQRAA
jgi:hypothetical protein